MFIFYIYLMLVCLNVYTDTKSIKVIGSGVKRFEKDDMMLIFFVTVEHIGNAPRRVMVTMNECCEDISGNDRDCDVVNLHGGDFGLIQPSSVKNFTLIYPNLYGYNRKGRCSVSILHRTPGTREVVEVYHNIEFDTRIKEDEISEWEELYGVKNVIMCETPDLDPFNLCNPVDCKTKYSGYRSFYNRRLKLCQKSKVCHTNLKKEYPDIIYVPISNDCRNLDAAFAKEDLEKIVGGKYQPEPMVNVRCHHGVINPKTGFCECDYGWKSEPYDPNLTTYSMCTIKCQDENSFNYWAFSLGVGLAFWLVIFVYVCERYGLFLVKRIELSSSQQEMLFYMLQKAEQCDHYDHETTYS